MTMPTCTFSQDFISNHVSSDMSSQETVLTIMPVFDLEPALCLPPSLDRPHTESRSIGPFQPYHLYTEARRLTGSTTRG